MERLEAPTGRDSLPPKGIAMTIQRNLSRLICIGLSTAALAACSGGGGSSSPAPAPPSPPLSTAALTCTGTEGAGWCWQRPQPSGARHRSLRFADAQLGWMVMEMGRLLLTTDGGATWRLQELGTRSDLADAVYLDARRGWAAEVFDRSFFTRFTTRLWATADGGQTWQRTADVPMEAVGSLRAFPPQTLVAIGLGNARFGVGATAVSDDGGQSWRVVRELDNVRSPLLTEGGVFGAAVSGHAGSGLWSTTFAGGPWLSGGAFGPEASAIAVALCLAAALALLAIARRRGRLVSPVWRRAPAPASA